MPTPPHSHVISNDPLPEDIQTIIAQAVQHLEEVRNFGTFVFKWLGEVQPPDPLRMAPMLLLRHTVELVDSISILIGHGNVDPSKIILRSLFETSMYIRFIVCDDLEPQLRTASAISDRSAAYMVWYYHQRRKRFESYDVTTEAGKQMQAEILKDDYAENDLISSLPPDVVKSAVDNIHAILAQPEYAQMEAVYQADLSNKREHRFKSWYQLAGGPRNIEGLAKHLRMGVIYRELYKSMSGMVHGSDIMVGRVAMSRRDNFAAFKQIRLLSDLPYVVSSTITYSVSIYRNLTAAYDPSHSARIHDWYQKEVMDYKNRVLQIKIQH